MKNRPSIAGALTGFACRRHPGRIHLGVRGQSQRRADRGRGGGVLAQRAGSRSAGGIEGDDDSGTVAHQPSRARIRQRELGERRRHRARPPDRRRRCGPDPGQGPDLQRDLQPLRLRRLQSAGHDRRCRAQPLHPDGQRDQGRDPQQGRRPADAAIRPRHPLAERPLHRQRRRSGGALRRDRRIAGC